MIALRISFLAILLSIPVPAAVVQTLGPVEVAGSNLEQSNHCDKGAPMRILANDSRLSILGSCSVITVVGSRNWISTQHARRIVTAGDRNTVFYEDRTTRVDDGGNANSVAERWPQ